MPASDPHKRLKPSILDRLTDAGPGYTNAGYELSDMIEKVRADLEALLNTHQTLAAEAMDRPRTRGSIVGFGLPDIPSQTALSNPALSPAERKTLEATVRAIVKATVERHEPRLRNVRVIVPKIDENKDRTIHFRIEAALLIDPQPAQPVAYDTTSTIDGKFTVHPFTLEAT